MTEKLSDIVKKYETAGAYMAPPADHIPSDVPLDYAAFLKLADGLQYNGILLFGVQTHASAEVDKNVPNAAREENGDWLIGRTTDGAVFMIEAESGDYLLRDDTSGDEFDRFSTISALLSDYLP